MTNHDNNALPELLPCPFCGETNVGTETDSGCADKWGWAQCAECGAQAPEVRTGYDKKPDAPWRAEAIAAWNRRAAGREGAVDDWIDIPKAQALIASVGPGYRVIYRSAFRWMDERGHVMPNHFECQSAPYLCEEHGHELILDLGSAAIIRDTRPTAPAGNGGEKGEMVREIIKHIRNSPEWDGVTFDETLSSMLRALAKKPG